MIVDQQINNLFNYIVKINNKFLNVHEEKNMDRIMRQMFRCE